MAIVAQRRETPPNWFRDDIGALTESTFPVRFRDDCWDAIERISAKYGVSRTMAIRILVQRSLRELGEL